MSRTKETWEGRWAAGGLVVLLAAACGGAAGGGERDAGTRDAGASDAGVSDAGASDAEASDGGDAGCAASPCFAWPRLLSGSSDEDEIDAVAADPEGNVWVSGKFEGTLQIEGREEPLVSAGHADIMIAKYSPTGELLFSARFGGAGEDNVFDADCDEEGNVVPVRRIAFLTTAA